MVNVVESTKSYPFTSCVGSFTFVPWAWHSDQIYTRGGHGHSRLLDQAITAKCKDRRDRRLLVSPPKDTGKAG